VSDRTANAAAVTAAARESRIGLLAGISAFTLWGLYPFYFKALAAIPALEIVAHRIAWSVVLLACMLPFAGQWRALVNAIRTPATLGWLAVTTVLISANWLVYVLAVTGGQVLDASLGYFLCPLVNVALGVVVLKERLTAAQTAAVALAAGAVLVPVWQLGAVPKVALFLAVSFGVYGMLRKRLAVDAATGLLVECVLALPLSAGIALWLGASGELRSPGADGWTWVLLLLSGFVTAGPLLLFTMGARRMPLATLGLLQYIAPSMLFLEGALVFGEPVEPPRLAAFVLIWAALALYTADGALRARRGASAG
jgi:chloramphenicol-sensitive protein RarD